MAHVMPYSVDDTMQHINDHVSYPATKQDIISACNEMSDVSDEEKAWVSENLPDKTYSSPDEVRAALQM